MTLFLFILGLFAIFCIGRYNESNKLFWTLLIAFVGGFTAANIAIESIRDNKTKVCKIDVQSTQVSNGLSDLLYLVTGNPDDALELTQNLVGKTANINYNTYQKESLPEVLTVQKLLRPPTKKPLYIVRYDDTS
mgnify:CR=1 FL=1